MMVTILDKTKMSNFIAMLWLEYALQISKNIVEKKSVTKRIMSPLKKDLKLKYFDLILKIIKTVETVIRLLNLLLIHDLSRGLIIPTPSSITVLTVSLSDSLPFLSELNY